jgi:hypothetical protein
MAASKPLLKHRVEQRITASDSTESFIRFCKEIAFTTQNSGKFNHRNSFELSCNLRQFGFLHGRHFQPERAEHFPTDGPRSFACCSLLTYGANKVQPNDGDGTFSGSVGLQS